MWVLTYREDRLLSNVNTNNGVETLNRQLKRTVLMDNVTMTLNRCLQGVVETFLPSLYER